MSAYLQVEVSQRLQIQIFQIFFVTLMLLCVDGPQFPAAPARLTGRHSGPRLCRQLSAHAPGEQHIADIAQGGPNLGPGPLLRTSGGLHGLAESWVGCKGHMSSSCTRHVVAPDTGVEARHRRLVSA